MKIGQSYQSQWEIGGKCVDYLGAWHRGFVRRSRVGRVLIAQLVSRSARTLPQSEPSASGKLPKKYIAVRAVADNH